MERSSAHAAPPVRAGGVGGKLRRLICECMWEGSAVPPGSSVSPLGLLLQKLLPHTQRHSPVSAWLGKQRRGERVCLRPQLSTAGGVPRGGRLQWSEQTPSASGYKEIPDPDIAGEVLGTLRRAGFVWCSSKPRQRSVWRLQRDGEGVTLINCLPTWGSLACCSSEGFFASGLVCHIKVDALPFRASAVPKPDHEIGQLSCLPHSLHVSPSHLLPSVQQSVT